MKRLVHLWAEEFAFSRKQACKYRAAALKAKSHSHAGFIPQ
jgi:hypothetical protein